MVREDLDFERCGEWYCEVNGSDAYIVCEDPAAERVWLYTPIDSRLWLDANGQRCADLGEIDCDAMPAGDARSEDFESWGASIAEAAIQSVSPARPGSP